MLNPMNFFERSDTDLYCVVPISFTQAALGAEIFVRTLDGKKIKLKIASGTQNGKILRIKGEGVPMLHGSGRKGDMYVKIFVEVPTKLNSKEKNMLKEFSETHGESSEPKPYPLDQVRRM
jgi:molecular chaperone DnaJ